MNDRSTRKWPLGTYLLLVPPLAVALLVGATLRHRNWNEPLFVYSSYYVLFTMLAAYLIVRFGGSQVLSSPRAWIRENLPGLVTTAIVSTVVILSVPPAFRVLADEANLVGVSKNLFSAKTANFAVTGKWYYENYWNINLVVDRRPALYPFLVSLLHTVRGYHVENAFHANAIIFALFLFSSYRLAKSLGGEVFGVAATILVAASPNTLVVARSAEFDLLSAFLLLLVVQSFLRYAEQPSPRALAALALTFCLLMHVRVEGMGLVAVGAVTLLAFRIFRWSHVRGYGIVYSLLPAFLASRYWQAVAKAHDAEQPLSPSMFGRAHFVHNLRAYVELLKHPLDFDGPHSRLLMILGALGCVVLVVRLVRLAKARALSPAQVQVILFVGALLGMEFVVCFAYSAGEPLQPASARLFLWLDTFLAFVSAWVLTLVGTRLAALRGTLFDRSAHAVTVIACSALFAMSLPIAQEARFVNALILTRQAAQTWKFFDQVGDKRILILTDRPGLYTIMNYGALDISTATANRNCLYELSRHLYNAIYLVQEMDLETKKPRAGFTAWSDVATQTVLEFQNTESSSVRIARVVP